MRLAFVRVHDLALAAYTRVEPDLAQRPLALLDAEQHSGSALSSVQRGQRVIVCTAAARALGVRVGMTGHQALAAAPEVALRGWSAEAMRAARAALLDAVGSVGARVESCDEGAWVDAGELARMHDSEGELAARLAQAARRVGLRVSVGVASSKGVAQMASRQRGGVAVVAAGDERAYMARVPLAAMPMGDEFRGALAQLGVDTARDLAAMPAAQIALRYGDEAAAAVRLAQGVDDRALVPEALPARFEESVELDWEVDDVDALIFALRRLLDALVTRLACRALAVGGMVLALPLASQVLDERALAVAVPTRDVATLLRIARTSLTSQPPIAGVRGLRVTALPRPVRPVQLGLFDPPGPAPERLALTLTKLTALVGSDRVGAPVAPDTHRPYAVAVASFDPPRAPREGPPSTEAIPLMALHVFRPPRDAEVVIERGRIAYLDAGEVRGGVRACGGPWRVDGQWWGEPFDHEGWDVELDDGGIYLVGFDRAQGRWLLDGVYE